MQCDNSNVNDNVTIVCQYVPHTTRDLTASHAIAPPWKEPARAISLVLKTQLLLLVTAVREGPCDDGVSR